MFRQPSELIVLFACLLLSLFAFNAKVGQYETVHSQITNISSTKIWVSSEKRVTAAETVADTTSAAPVFCAVVLFLAAIAPLVLQSSQASGEDAETIMSPVEAGLYPSIFRRPPPRLS